MLTGMSREKKLLSRFLLAAALAITLLIPSSTFAAGSTFYVSLTGSDSNPCTQTLPCKTLKRGFTVASLGDTVVLASGNYPAEEIPGSLSKGSVDVDTANVVFQPASGATVVLEELRVLTGHIELRNLTVENYYARYDSRTPSSMNASDLVLDGVKANTVQVTSVRIGAIRNSDLGPSQNSDGAPNGGDVFKLYNYPNFDGHHSRDWAVENTKIHDAQVNLGNSADHVDCFQSNGGERIRFNNVSIWNCYHLSFLVKADTGPTLNFTVENSVFASSGWQLVAYSNLGASGSHTVRNNSFLTSYPLFNTGSTNSAAHTGTNVFYSNILKSPPSNGCTKNSTDVNVVWAYNVFETGPVCGSNAYLVPDGDVGYVNRISRDAHLTSTSEAIGRGHPTSYPSLDMDGQTRPQGTSVDAGADEFFVTAPPPPPPVGPHELKYSTSTTRSPSSLLSGAAVAGQIAVFTDLADDHTGITKVEFRLNGTLIRTESNAPYDYFGGTATASNLGTFSSGTHTIEAKVYHSDGVVETQSATFTDNG